MFTHQTTTKVKIADHIIGGGNPILVQSMVNVDSHDSAAVIKQIHALEEVGCDIVRIGFLDLEAVTNIGLIKKHTHLPLVADIHLDYRLALEAINQGIDKIRLNPGNIGSQANIAKVVTAAKKAGVPIRIGVNTGSIEAEILAKYHHPTAAALVESAQKHIKILEDLDFGQIVVSVKASDVQLMITAYQLLAQTCPYPLHLGVTEAGTERASTIKSSLGIGSLLLQGIGDTIRVSLTGDPVEEVLIGRDILKYLNFQAGPVLIACPTCSRTQYDLIPLAHRVEAYLKTITAPIKVAIMGCVVNGPGEARECDIGIAGGKGQGVLFMKGKVIKNIPEAQFYDELIAGIKKMT